MTRDDPYTARFDEVDAGGRARSTVGEELRERDPDGATPTEAWFHGEEYRLETELDDGVAVYVRRL